MVRRWSKGLFALFVMGGVGFSEISLAEEITIFGNHEKPPKVFQQKGEAKGLLVEMMRYIDKQLPQEFQYKLLPWNRAYTNMLNGKGGIIGLSKNSERLKVIDYSEAMYVDELVLVVLKGKEFSYQSLEDLKGKRLGHQQGSSYGDTFDQARGTVFSSHIDGSSKMRLLKLLSGRIDVALIGPGAVGVQQVIQHNPFLAERADQFVVLPTPFKRDPNYLGFPKSMKMQGFLSEFNHILRRGQMSGEIQAIIDRHYQG